jgi:citrate lyase synthetase
MKNGPKLKIKRITKNEAEEVQHFVIKVINTSYTPYYPKEAINFFKDFYSIEKIQNDINSGYYILIKENNKIIATGLFKDNHIGGVFVDAEKQGKGIGKIIMSNLEKYALSKSTKKIVLEASIPSFEFYKKLAYKKISDRFISVDNGKKLDYIEMKKKIN